MLPGDTTVLDASGSVDPNGMITKYEFDLDNNGSFEVDNGTQATYDASFGSRGNYPVHVRVTDDTDKTGIATVLVHVTQAPIASIDASPSSPLSQENVTFDGSASSDPDGAPLTKYEWDLDDDGTFELDTGHDADDDDPVRDAGRPDGAAAGDRPGRRERRRLARPHRPEPHAHRRVHQACAGRRGSPASFNAAASSDLDGSIAKYEWSFDGDDTYEVDAGGTPRRRTRSAPRET